MDHIAARESRDLITNCFQEMIRRCQKCVDTQRSTQMNSICNEIADTEDE